MAVVAGVSAAEGLIHLTTRPKSFNSESFGQFLAELHEKSKSRPLIVLLDNCKIHKTNQIRNLAETLGIILVFNVPYHPELNGIELVWSIAKRRFKTLQLQRMLGKMVDDFTQCIETAMREITNEEIAACYKNGLK